MSILMLYRLFLVRRGSLWRCSCHCEWETLFSQSWTKSINVSQKDHWWVWEKNENIIDEFENDDFNQDLHRWWFESRCSNKKMIVTARSWEEVVKDPRFKPWKFFFSFLLCLWINLKLKNCLVLASFPYWKYKTSQELRMLSRSLSVNLYSSMSWLKFCNLSVHRSRKFKKKLQSWSLLLTQQSI